MERYKKLTEEQKKELTTLISKTGTDTKEIRRAQAILLIDQGASFSSIFTLTGYKRRGSFLFRQRYLKAGLKGIEHKRKGKPKTLLTLAQREEILHILERDTPQAHGYNQPFWTSSILADLIKEKYGVVYKTKRPFYLLFQEAKMTFHKPGQVYEKRDEEKVAKWKEEIKPKLEDYFADPNKMILCEDEMVLSSKTTFQKIWLKQGEYPKIEVSNTKENRSIYGFLNIKNGLCHAFVKERQNMHITVDILKEIRKIYPNQEIVILWDGASWHRGKAVGDYIKEDKKIELIYFPPYSPEENPQEHVWKKGRAHVTHNKFMNDIEKSAQEFWTFLNEHIFPYQLLKFSARS